MESMKGLLRSAGVFAVVALTACGGGGGGGGGGVVPPQQTVVNTSSPYYLPFKAGNRWVFSTNGSITDAGAFTTNCAGCAIQGLPTEGMDIFDTTGAYSTTFFFAKTNSAQTSGRIDTLIGTSTDHGATVSLISDGPGHYGIPVNDSAAFIGETWSNGGGTSTITGVNGTQPYGSNGIIQSVNTDHLTGPGLDVQFGFARGVGFTSLTAGGQTATLTSFSIDAANSLSIGRSPASRPANVTGTISAAAALSQLRALF